MDWFLYNGANQWTGFYMITVSVMKGLTYVSFVSDPLDLSKVKQLND